MLHRKVHGRGLNMTCELVPELLDPRPIPLQKSVRIADASGVQRREPPFRRFEFLSLSDDRQAAAEFNQRSKATAEEIANPLILVWFAQFDHASVEATKFVHLEAEVFVENR